MSLLTDAFNTLGALERTSSTLDKKVILGQARDNNIFLEMLQLCYNPFKMYYIKKLPEITPIHASEDNLNNYILFIGALRDLTERQFTGQAAMELICSVLIDCNSRELKWFTRILQKDLNIGIKYTTINEVFPKLIPVFEVMLAKQLIRYPREFIMQPKLDGIRAMCNTTTGEMYSRNGKRLEKFFAISDDLQKLSPGYWVDGEIMTGKFNNTMSRAFKKYIDEDKGGFLNAFDILSESDFSLGRSNQTFISRDIGLDRLLKDHPVDTIIKVQSSPVLTPSDMNKADDIYASYLSDGYEGAMIKDCQAIYECKRKDYWQKLKPVQTFDIKVIDIENGKDDTKYSDQVGKLVCRFGDIEVRVGSGLSDDQRLLWSIHPERIVGKTIEVEAQSVTENKKGTTSLRFPRFVRVREDLE